MSEPFYGKFRGTVEDDRDPLGLGRVRVFVPQVLGGELSTWALPCIPCTNPDHDGILAIPSVGTNVWVEFEGGKPEHPIWTGCFWTTAAGAEPARQSP